MEQRRVVQGLTVTFGAMSVVLAVVGLVTNPIALVLGVFFAGVTGLLYYQASGRLARRVYRRVEQRAAVDGGTADGPREARAGRGGFGAGPREAWTGPRQQGGRGARDPRGASRGAQRSTRGAAPVDDGLTARQAYDVLGLEPDADQEAVRSAYRDRIKEVHPDAEGGDEAAFRRVRSAYERLAD